MLGKRSKGDEEAEVARPKVHVTSKGKMYIRPEELLNSKIGKQRVKEMAEFAERQMKVVRSSKRTDD